MISMKGYISYKSSFGLDTNQTSLNIGFARLKPDYALLAPVIVTHSKPIEVSEDTVSYLVSSFSSKSIFEVESLLKRLPGLEIDQSGDVIYQGQKISRVTVDGKLFFGGDVKTAIKNLPIEIIEKIQIVDDYGDQARLMGVKTGEPVKTLNLALKSNTKSGFFGNLSNGLGSSGKYSNSASINSFRDERQFAALGSIDNNTPSNIFRSVLNTSYANKWGKAWKEEGNASYAIENTSIRSLTDREDYFNNSVIQQGQSSMTESKEHNINIGSIISYIPSPMRTFRIIQNLKFDRLRQNDSSNFSNIETDSSFKKTANGNTSNSTTTKAVAYGLDAYLEQALSGSKGRLVEKAGVSFSTMDQNNDNLLINSIQADSITSRSTQHRLLNNRSGSLTINAGISYFSPLGEHGALELGYSYWASKNINKKYAWDLESATPTPSLIDSLSETYSFYSHNHDLRAAYSVSLKKLSLNLAMDLQPGAFTGAPSSNTKDVQYRYTTLNPLIQLSYNPSRANSLSLQYIGTSQLPGIQQVDPIVNITNPQYLVFGNPSLKPAYLYRLSFRYERSFVKARSLWSFGFTVGHTDTKNAIIESVTHPKDSTSIIQTTTYINSNGPHSEYIIFHLNLPAVFKRTLRVSMTGNITNSQTASINDNILYLISSLRLSQVLHFQFIVPDHLETDLSGVYNYTRSSFSMPLGSYRSFRAAEWNFQNKYYILHNFIISSQLTQNIDGTSGSRPIFYPILANTVVQWKFMNKERGMLSLNCYDLFNKANSTTQVFSASSVIRTQTNVLGRYLILSFSYKWGKFGKE